MSAKLKKNFFIRNTSYEEFKYKRANSVIQMLRLLMSRLKSNYNIFFGSVSLKYFIVTESKHKLNRRRSIYLTSKAI